MKKIFLFSFIILILLGRAMAQTVTIYGPTEVCPNQEYTYTVETWFLVGGTGNTALWSLTDENGVQLAVNGGSQLTFAFPHPQNKTYKLKAVASGGVGGLSTASSEITIRTRYPIPTISGPKYICAGGSGVITTAVDASSACFHHKIDYLLPTGWVATPVSSGKMSIAVPAAAENKYYTIKARVWYDDANYYGDYTEWRVWVGAPGYTGSSRFVSDVNSNSTYVYTYSNAVRFYVPSGVGDTYRWKILSDQSCGSTYKRPIFYSYGNGTPSATTTESYINVNTGTCSGTFRIGCYATNTCGVTTYSERLFRVSSSGGGGCVQTLSVYPNPSRVGDQLTISLVPPPPGCTTVTTTGVSSASVDIMSSDDMISNIDITDYSGNRIVLDKTKFESEHHVLSMTGLNPGLYYLTVRTAQGRTYRQRLIKE